MYINRDVDQHLLEWKNDKRRKPLLLRGVRQCGKTSTVRHLGESFSRYIEVNLEKMPALHDAFNGNIDIKRILSRVELETGVRVVPGETLLFIDEIQECPRAISSIRYFFEDMPELHVIAAGSLLEFVLKPNGGKEPLDFPVGRVRSIYMYPLSFTEYLRGTGKELVYEQWRNGVNETMDDGLHEKLLECYKEFLVVGGMPEAVVAYLESGSILESQYVHKDIVTSMMDDFGKYSRSVSPEQIRRVFEFCLHNVCSQTKATSAIEGISGYYFDECIRLLSRAGLVHPVKVSSCESIPLGTSEKETKKKLLVFDTGIYLTECELDMNGILAAHAFGQMNCGDVVEMQTGLELIKYSDPYRDASLYYWYRSGANAELDYVIVRGGTILPVEVKASGKGSMQSLRRYMELHKDVPYGIRVSMEKRQKYGEIRVYPVYDVVDV